jgi:anion-transporting  ArsA/GET3 family ATPase
MLPQQKLLFVLGKGGVGRSTVSAALAELYAQQGRSVLIVQWAVHDSISPQFGKTSSLSHEAHTVAPGVSVMNYQADEAIREYFVDHLKMGLIHKMVIENKHVQRFLHAAPGVQELFFLGRLFWLVCLAIEERGWSYDHVIVDAPAMGHGVSLFRIAPTIASLGITGPLAAECERVTRMLYDSEAVGTVVVTIPEELPVEETLEFLPRIEKELNRPPLFVVLNRAFAEDLDEKQIGVLLERVCTAEAKQALKMLAQDLRKREAFAGLLVNALARSGTPLLRILDVHMLKHELTPSVVREQVVRELKQSGLG